jgi:hypothetical protein
MSDQWHAPGPLGTFSGPPPPGWTPATGPPGRRQRRGLRYWANHRKVAGVFGGILAVLFAVLALAHYSSMVDLRDRGAVVPGTVVGVDKIRHKYADVRFTTLSGERIRTRLSSSDLGSSPKRGERIQIRYDPGSPTIARDARLRPNFFEAWGMAAGAAFSVVLAVLAWMGRLPRLR